MDTRPKLKPCPFCGKTPEIVFHEECAEKFGPFRAGRKAIAFTWSCCVACHRERISGRGEKILWGKFDRDRPYKDDEWYATQDAAEASCIRSWNRKVAAWNRRKADAPAQEGDANGQQVGV